MDKSTESLDFWDGHRRLDRIAFGDDLAEDDRVLPAGADDVKALRSLVGRQQFEVVLCVLPT
jgi:hypothetical protein